MSLNLRRWQIPTPCSAFYSSCPSTQFLPVQTTLSLSPSHCSNHGFCRISSSVIPLMDSNHLLKETEQTLEWHRLCSQVSTFASTPMAASLCRNAGLPLGRTMHESQQLLNQTTAAALLPRPLDFAGIEDISEIVSSALSGELPTIGELCVVERTLMAARSLLGQLEELCLNSEVTKRYLPLIDILGDCKFLIELARKIGYCIDCNLSVVLDRASANLELLRSERKRNMESLESLLKETSNMVFQARGIDSPLVTKRRSRMCVGIRASHRSLLPGSVILDVSSSGATYFVEPKEAIELNNLEVRLANSEKAEERAVLSLLASEVAGSEKEIRYLMEKVLELDLASARGFHSHWINGVCPSFFEASDENELGNSSELHYIVDFNEIQHPLLLGSSLQKDLSVSVVKRIESSADAGKIDVSATSVRSANRQSQFLVPLDIKIQQGKKIVIISGPNTGGKTATMKTLGLAVLMSKAGLFLPCTGCPMLPWFDQVLADIGDHQSLEHSLSTFSGHILRLCGILEFASPESLILIDEIGSGTDPSEGLALSTSILHYIVDRAKLSVVTTHYADLSFLKLKDHRFENAAMDFSLETLQPTYRVLWGSTGSSNALNIAKLVGLDQKVLDRAHEWVEKLIPDKQEERRGVLYQSLLKEKQLLEDQAKKAIAVYSEIKKLYDEISYEAENLDEREVALKAKESMKVRQELQTAKLEIDSVVKNFDLRIGKISYDQVNSLLKGSEAAVSSIIGNHCVIEHKFTKRSANNVVYKPQVGDKVYVKGFGNMVTTVVETSGDDSMAIVQYGKMKMIVKKDDMIRAPTISKKDSGAQSFSQAKGQVEYKSLKRNAPPEAGKELDGLPYGPAIQTSKNTVDLRGKRLEEAAHYLKMAINVCEPKKVVFIIHGMGTGVVKERALEILRNHPRVSRFEQESPMNYGCTLAYVD